MKKKKLTKKELAIRIKRLVVQFSDLNNRFNRVSHDKLSQGLQLDQLSEANSGLQQRLQEMQTQIEQLISQEEELSRLLGSLQLQTSDEMAVEEAVPEQQETQRNIIYLNEQLATLHEQHQSFRHALEHDSQSADTLSNNTDDLRRDVADLLSHIRRLEESGSELLVSDSQHASQIQRLQNDIAELSRKLEQGQSEQENPQQEVSRLLQETAQPLQQDIEHLRQQFSERGGQQKALEQRLLELANRIGETGARLESQQPQQRETQEKIDDLNDQLAALHEQHQSLRRTLEQDSQSADVLANKTDDLRRDMADLLSHIRRLEESGSELLVSDSQHASQIQSLQNDIAELSRKLEQSQSAQANPQQEVSRLLQESAQPLQQDIEHLKQQLSERGGQQKALEQRLLELANRIGETGARLESQQPQQRETQQKIDDLNDQLAALHEQHQSFRRTLEQDSQSADVLANNTDDLRRDMADLLSHIRRLEESGSELLVSDSQHASQIQSLQNDIAELSRKLEQSQSAQANPQQEVSRLMQENAQPLQQDIEHLRQQLSEKSGQQKGLEQRLLELANRIGETGARLENHQQDKRRNNEVLEQRLSKLETMVQDLQPVSNADATQLAALEQKLSQAEGDMESLLADKNRALTARLDSLDAALNEQAVKSTSLHDLVNQINSDSAANSRSLEERLAAMDLRLSGQTDQQTVLPDPLLSIKSAIEEQKERLEDTARQLKQEISALHEKMQALDTDEDEAADWLSSLAANVDQQAKEREQLQEAFATTKSDINRRLDEVKARLIITERQLKDQEETAQGQLHKLANLVEEMAEQGRHGVDLKLATAALQEDSSQLKESNGKLNERIESLQRTLQQGEENQTRITQQLSAVEQEQRELRELSEGGMDSLQGRVKTALAQLAEQSGQNEGLSQRLDDLESSLQGRFSEMDSRHQLLLETESENRERLTRQEQNNHALSTVITELKTDHQELLEQSEKQKPFLDAIASEYGKHQEESKQTAERLDLLDAQVESTRSNGKYQGFALGGLFSLLLLSILFGYQFFSGKLGSIERDTSLQLMTASENYLTKDEIEQSMRVVVARLESVYDPQAVEALIDQQDALERRLDEFEQKTAKSTIAVAGVDQTAGQAVDQAPDQAPGQAEDQTADRDQGQAEETEALETSNESVKVEAQPQQPVSSQDSWRALRDRGGYTIQLIGVSDKEAITAFADKHDLPGELAYITTEREGKAWYILLHGIYASYTEAANALQAFPEALKARQPWIRKMPNKGTISGF